MTHPPPQSLDKRLLINVLLLLLLFFVLVNFYFVYQLKGTFYDRQPPPPPRIELYVITAPDCPDCFDINPIALAVRNSRTNITKEERTAWDQAASTALIKQYGISRAPAIIVTGEVSDLTLPSLANRNNALVFDTPTPPFIDTASGTIAGRTRITVITAASCKSCFNITTTLNQVSQVVSVIKTTHLDAKDKAAKELFITYNLSKVPAIILSRDAELYPIVNRTWDGLGSREADGSLVLRALPPPYLDLATGQVRGLVAVTYLTDSSCTSCYNASIHQEVLSQIGLVFGKHAWIDTQSPEGSVLITQYNITAVPTILLSQEVLSYPLLNQIWPQVGTVEEDGTHVFRNLEALGPITWKDLTTGKVRGPPSIIVNLTDNSTRVVNAS